MYRFAARRVFAQSTQTFSKRSFSNQGFRAARASKTNLYLGAGIALVPTIMSINYLNGSHIANEVDEKKVEEGKEKAEATGKKEIAEDAEKKAIGKGEVKTKVPAEEANPETRTEVEEESQKDGEESYEGAAYNPETGEINWDCPCLGGMAHGPCGEEFKEAFSCFIYSEAEPKGIECIKKFENMRNCFREHPEHYKEELYDDEEQEPLVDVNEKKGDASEQSAETVADDATKVVKAKAEAEDANSK
ncbi:Mitochondrial intermembrane space import and assembly protein 40 [Debaryomyces fabryi]|uniref:Mitochondrial intermembrane space import and assembly protein 40 n=1 Tax=Debaryomyces fabryi TaxID=58627 RepID=A0A0V1PYD1_9ASCO|nr:Mitochondrial intermembrane space import and assembly protein 40 [Debaryomyces fabryi]KSA01255.1 Mitochondrial intermembrane space import and assembly protein 40 [Debaryomyces fabryi]CUM47030.1 unnamed protein product [Debaryomyces fabryi]